MGGHTLPELPYAYDALEPYIDARTMENHHAHHQRAHVEQLNTILEQLHPSLRELSAEELLRKIDQVPEDFRSAVRNHAGGLVNHSVLWSILSPESGGAPTGALAEAIDETFGSFKDFQGRFSMVAANHFGSGWAWLFTARGKLVLYSLPNQDSPLMVGEEPIFGIDLWEHAYYLKHEWRQADYIESFWNVVNWEEVGRRYEAAQQASQARKPACHQQAQHN